MREIVSRVESFLEKTGFAYSENRGCFDVAAKKRKNFFILKVLNNVDSIREEQAINLRTISVELGSTAFIVGERTRKEELEKDVIYQRFDIPTLSIDALENIFLHKYRPIVSRKRGGLFVDIDSEMLRKQRQKLGLTQEELAQKAGTTKKSIYEHERQSKKASKELADSLESVLGKVSSPFSFKAKKRIKNEPKGQFESFVARHFRSIGFETNSVYQAPFNLIAKNEELTILSEAEEKREKIEKMLEEMISFSRLCRKPIIAVTKEETDLEIPTIAEKDLRGYSARDIRKLIRSW